MLPGADCSFSEKTVWIESTISTTGLTRAASSRIRSRQVSASRYSGGASRPSRSPRIFNCWTDSSPEAYSTGPSVRATAAAICSSSVDLPIPGSPPSNTAEPGTMPPPSTRSSSPLPLGMRSASAVSTWS